MKIETVPHYLFVCSRNRRCSLTAEDELRGARELEVRSAGLIGWADAVFFMEKLHLDRARLRFAEELQCKTHEYFRWPE